MEKIVVFFVLLGSLVAISLSIYLLFPPVNSLELLERIFQKIEKIDKLRVSYSLSFTYFYDSSETTNEGSLEFIHANKNSKSLIKLESSPNIYFSANESELAVIPPLYPFRYNEAEFYSIPEGNIICIKTSIITQQYSCAEFEPIYLIGEYPSDLLSQIKLLKEWVEKKIVNASYLGKREYINRKCDYFKFDVDVSKVRSELKTSLPKQNASYIIFSCFDEKLGIPLFHSYEIIARYSYGTYSYSSSFKGNYEVKSLSFYVDESQIKLPVPLNKVQWLPRFRIVETLCQEDSNEIKLAIESIKDLPSGSANLNISTTETTATYPRAQVDGYNHYCFYLSDIKHGSTLKFTFSSINDSYSRQFIIGIDCKEAHGKRLYPSYPYGCEDCSEGGKYCSMGTYKSPSYYFSSDLSGNHEICVWPTSEKNYLWQLDMIEIKKSVSYESKTSFEGMKKGETKILTFSIPSTFKKGKFYSLNLEIEGFKSSGYCYPSISPPPIPSGFFAKLIEKIINITQAT